MSAPAVLFANEMGGGRGHVASLARLSRAFPPDLPRLAAVPWHGFAGELAAAGCRLELAPGLWRTAEMQADPALAGNAGFACVLAACGLSRPEVVRNGLLYWRDLIVQENISILVADYAPLALRAARGLQDEGWEIRILSTGTGFGAPPAQMPAFPVLFPEDFRIVHPEAETLALFNAVSAEIGLAPLPALPALFDADRTLAATFDILDPYAGARPAGDLCPPLVERAAALAAGDEVFIYFSRTEADTPEVLAALCDLDMPRRAFLPQAAPGTLARLAAAGVAVETVPVPASLIAARSRLVFHSAPHGTLCMAALAGLPQLGLPAHREQLLHGRRATTTGAVRLIETAAPTAAEISGAIAAAHEDAGLRDRARGLATRLRETFPQDPLADLAARLAPEVEIARGFVTG